MYYILASFCAESLFPRITNQTIIEMRTSTTANPGKNPIPTAPVVNNVPN